MLNISGLAAALNMVYGATLKLFRTQMRSSSDPEEDIAAYIHQLWRFEQVVKVNLPSLYDEAGLIKSLQQSPMNLLGDEAEACVAAVISEGLVDRVSLQINGQTVTRLLARPGCILTMFQLKQRGAVMQSISEEELHTLANLVNGTIDKILRETLFHRLLHEIGAQNVAPRHQQLPQPRQLVFALFLLLGRMVRDAHALHLKQTNDGRYELQRELVDALNRLGEGLFQDGWTPSRWFKMDKFSRELQRRGALQRFFDDHLKWRLDPEGGEIYYFAIGDYEKDPSTLRFVVGKLILGLSKFGPGIEEAGKRLETVRSKFIIEFPLTSVDRDLLQPHKPEIAPYSSALQNAIREAASEQTAALTASPTGYQLRLTLDESCTEGAGEDE